MFLCFIQESLVSNDLSTTGLGKVFGVTAKPFLFDLLVSESYLTYSNKAYSLTPKGEAYGYLFCRGSEQWVLWHADKIGFVIEGLKRQHLAESSMNAMLYHMTHIDNLFSILSKGLFSHSDVTSPFDISDKGVNSRRQSPEPIHKRPIHDYVPLYFNVRNPMLFRVQREYGDNIIILEFAREVCLLQDTLFTYNNAASSYAVFYYCVKKFSEAVQWDVINSRYWNEDYEVKLAVMSECLIWRHLDKKFIKSIHCQNKKVADKVCSLLDSVGNTSINVYYDSHLFF